MSKPFVKWAGGKRQLLPIIEKNLPEGLGDSITRYCEPFIGGGALLFHLLGNYAFEEVYIGDMNHGLISTYKSIRDNCDEMIESLALIQAEYDSLETLDDKKDYYLARRTEYNHINMTKNCNSSTVRLASLFIFLNKAGFNGMYRVNKSGGFNIPFGKHVKPIILDEVNLKNVSASLKGVSIVHAPYQDSFEWIDGNTFVYLDPPYRPLNISSSFNSYTADGFNDKDQLELAQWVENNHDKGAKIMLSNSDPKNTDENDTFFDDAYNFANIQRVSAKRNINSDASKRGKINEILVTTY